MRRFTIIWLLLFVGCAQAMPQIAGEQAAAAPGKPAAVGRKIIDRATVELRVTDVDAFASQLSTALSAHEGYLESSSLERSTQSGRWVVRVPSTSFQAFLAESAEWGTVLRTQSSAEDVTDQFIDVTARLETKRVEEQRLQTLLTEQTGTLADVLAVEKELARVRGEIEQAEGRQRYLEQQTSYGTIEIRATELVQVGFALQGSFSSQIAGVFRDSCLVLVTFLRIALLVLIAVIPWLALAAIPGFLIWRWIVRQRREEYVTVELRDATPQG